MKKLLSIVTFLLLAGAAPAMAVCTVPSPVTASFGTATSFAANTTSSSVNSTINVNCGPGAILALLSADTITLRGTATTFSSPPYPAMGLGSDVIPFRICFDTGCANELLTTGNTYTIDSSKLLGLNLGGSTQVNFGIPIYLYTRTGAVVAAGTYTTDVSILVTWNVCTGIGLLGACLLGSQNTGSTTMTLRVSMIVTNDCTTLTTQPIAFGSAPLVSQFTTFSGNITVVCTKGSTYTVGITNGQHATGTQRYMISGSTLLAYQIYKGTGTTYWGPTGTDRQSSSAVTANADFITRVFPFNARILTTQNTPVAGSYTDTVSVDVSF
ncbi:MULTISPECIES: spore coat U domain-containing protein [unclassified Erwinia]|uniref:Csu type fimbrial protein n=1 Tax=unclassified Erwinia TaxID=2622719 RepID=UPI00070230CE|nr:MULTISPECIES: spore coat U domain-containing protein [unclassified Erwinia]KQN64500.1 fimbrial protein [Erwinia sp. Leaf53]PLV60830.1 fimbrial protein [Erwinia sp. B116]